MFALARQDFQVSSVRLTLTSVPLLRARMEELALQTKQQMVSFVLVHQALQESFARQMSTSVLRIHARMEGPAFNNPQMDTLALVSRGSLACSVNRTWTNVLLSHARMAVHVQLLNLTVLTARVLRSLLEQLVNSFSVLQVVSIA